MSIEMKVTTRHRQRIAYLNVRQSTLRQVFENRESTQCRYGLRQQTVALGWPLGQSEVIDGELEQSVTSSVDRLSFQPLVVEVELGRAGIPSETAASREGSASRELRRLLADRVLKNQGFPSRRILRHQVCQENNVLPIGFPSSGLSIHNDPEGVDPCLQK